MFDYKQRPTTDEYRENWEQVYSDKGGEQSRSSGRARAIGEDDRIYPNGCPILSEEDGGR